MNSRICDVAVLGAGPAGCATALALARQGVSNVCVVEPADPSGMQVGETLPPDTAPLLDELGVWDGFIGDGHEPCLGSCSAWGADELGYNDFICNPFGQGWHLDRPRFNSLLLRSVGSSGIEVISESRLLDLQMDRRRRFRLQLTNAGGEAATLTARYVVDATGIRSAFARRVGARRLLFDRLTFVYGFFEASAGASRSQLTMTEAAEDGWWYASGLPGRRVVASFATEPETVRELMLSREDRWFARLLRTRHVGARLAECRFVRGSLVIRAAPSFVLDRVAGSRWLAAGDAAAAYDPVSSQGIHKALADGLEAARSIASALACDGDIAPSYAASITGGFKEYSATRDYLYRLENRWAKSPFWRHRQERVELPRPGLFRLDKAAR